MTCGASVSAAIGGLGAGCRVVGGEFDGELVGCVLPLTGSLQLVETRFGVDLHRELPAHADRRRGHLRGDRDDEGDRKSTRLNSSHVAISYAVFCLKKKRQLVAAGTQTA